MGVRGVQGVEEGVSGVVVWGLWVSGSKLWGHRSVVVGFGVSGSMGFGVNGVTLWGLIGVPWGCYGGPLGVHREFHRGFYGAQGVP